MLLKGGETAQAVKKVASTDVKNWLGSPSKSSDKKNALSSQLSTNHAKDNTAEVEEDLTTVQAAIDSAYPMLQTEGKTSTSLTSAKAQAAKPPLTSQKIQGTDKNEEPLSQLTNDRKAVSEVVRR